MKIRDEIHIWVSYHKNVQPKRAKVVYVVNRLDERVYGDTTVTIFNVEYEGVEIGQFTYDLARDRYMVDGGSYYMMRSPVEYIFDRHMTLAINRAL